MLKLKFNYNQENHLNINILNINILNINILKIYRPNYFNLLIKKIQINLYK